MASSLSRASTPAPLVRHLRDNGSKMGIISTEIFDVDELAERLAAAPTLVGENLVKTVVAPRLMKFVAADLPATHDFALSAAAPARHKVVAYDCGVKRRHPAGSGPRGLRPYGRAVGHARRGGACDEPRRRLPVQRPRATPMPWGNVRPGREAYRQGAGLWHLSWSPDDQPGRGAQMEKLKFGHRGGNQPVMNLRTPPCGNHRAEPWLRPSVPQLGQACPRAFRRRDRACGREPALLGRAAESRPS